MGGSRKYHIPHSAFRNRTLYPVILPVPSEVSVYKPRERVIFLSAHARKALALSAQKSGLDISLADYNKDPEGAPLPVDGIYWSITHKTEYVGGVVSSQPLGIDIEKIVPCSAGLFARTAGEKEWALSDHPSDGFTVFHRYWTAKEAVVKASTIGIKDLLKCRVHQIIDDHHLEIEYLNKRWQVEHFFFDDHVASIVQHDFKIEWTIG